MHCPPYMKSRFPIPDSRFPTPYSLLPLNSNNIEVCAVSSAVVIVARNFS
ncbi:MAG: hypothetical protein F6K50_49725 [Moorea sp. SIO3I7]|nr:hypothetical protein [Moorena sp. SIO3I7]